MIAANNRFALNFYSNVIRHENSNIFFSPWSISSAFAIVYEGAREKSAEEIQRVFGFPVEGNVRRSSFAAIQNGLDKNDGNYVLNTANALWIKEGYRLSRDFVNIARQYYDSEVASVNFATDEGPDKINRWIEAKTNNKIKGLVPPGSTDSTTTLVITNAVYFKGSWMAPFEESDTSEEEFRVSQDKTVKVSMMKLDQALFNYTETEELQVLELPYKGNKISMLILLPRNDTSLKSIEESISLERLGFLFQNYLYGTMDNRIENF